MRALAFAPLIVLLAGCPKQNSCEEACAGQIPPSECTDGATLRSYAPATACSGACQLLMSDRRCDLGCRDGQCVTTSGSGGGAGGGTAGGMGGGAGGGAGTSCAGVTCNTPPANVCADASTLRVFEPAGVCSSGQCSYSARTEACSGGCVNGACAGNPCQGVTCTTPPANTCADASTLKVFSASGTCSNGTCAYADSRMTCPFGCQNGACVNDPCAGKTCNQPPATFCFDASTLRSFGTAGVCSGGGCIYTPTDSTCQFGCANGACMGNPCQGVSCNQPPAPSCVSATTLRTFGTAGVCSGGSCLYTPSDSTCQFGCANGACMGNPCQGVSCNQPPASTCTSPTSLRSFQAPGSCSGGACTYAPLDTTCTFGCQNGACLGNPCTGVTCNAPPASTCVSATTLRSFASPGTCSGGACSYAPTDTTCQFGCANGACQGDPCQGVSCTTPPAAACVTASTLRTFASPGSCSGGGCTYAPTDTSCPFGCQSGACRNDPCAGVSCTTPPARACVGSSVRTYSAPGTCSSGACSYAFTDAPCANGCSNGTCNAPTCGGQTCNTPPASTCTNANTLSTYYPVGACAGTSCMYSQLIVTCSAGCLNGACIAGSWTLEAGPYVPLRETQVVYDSAGFPLMAGCDSNGQVKVRRLSEAGWREETVDTGMGSFCEASVALDANDEPMVAYFDSVNADLRFALRNGGTWMPKELVANQDNAGQGVSLGVDPQGRTVVAYSYSGPAPMSAVKLATRGASGGWTEEVAVPGTTARTRVLVAGGALHVVIDASTNPAVATRTGAGWSLAPIWAGTSWSVYDLLENSLVIEGGVPKVMMKYNSLRGGGNWVWRTSSGPSSWTEENFGAEVPKVIRTTLPRAALVTRGQFNTPVIRVQTNGVWLDTVNPVPYGTQITSPVSYVGAGGRHILLDATGRRLTSPASCTPVCSGRTCGDDGCGGSCGTCASGQCAPNGTCSAFRQITLPGGVPQYAALGSGPSLHIAESASSSFANLLHRIGDGGTFSMAAEIPGSGNGTLSERDLVPVDPSDVPYVVSNRSSPVNGTHVWSKSGGAWSSLLASSAQGAHFDVDASGNWHLIECSTTAVSYRQGANGAWSGAATLAYARPSGFDGLYCLNHTVNAAGRVSVLLVRSYWVSGTNPGQRYDLGVLTNESGAWVHSAIPGIGNMSFPGGQLRYDGSGALHFLNLNGTYQVRPAGGVFTSEAAPMGLPTSSGDHKRLLIDRSGVAHLVFIETNQVGASWRVTLARRTAAGTWSLESAPLMQGLAGTTASSYPNFLGAAFDAANRPWFIIDDQLTYRAITR